MSNQPELIWERGAVLDLSRLREFIMPHNPVVASNAAQSIIKSANLLADNPYLGHPMDNMPEFNELFIPFGQNGYVLRYRIDNNKIVILRIWHARKDR